MRNHDQKITDMVESALPSTRRRSAQTDRRLIHHRERARLRAALHGLAGYDDPDDFAGDLSYRDKSGISDMVGNRREADKLGPLLRWAERRAEDLVSRRAYVDAELLAWFRASLPDTTAGRHACDHIEWVIAPPRWWLRLQSSPGQD